MSYVQETRERGHRGTRRGRSPPHYVREDPKEEGELQDTGSANKGFQTEGKTSTSNNPQHESNGAKVNLVKVPPKPLGLENGAKAVIASETVGAGEEMAPPLVDIGKDNTGNEVMDLEETGNPIAGDEGFMCEDDDFQNLTDGEMEDLNGSQEVVLETVEEESRPKETEEKGLQVGEEEKKKGARKLLLKQTMAAGTSKKKKFRHSFHRTEMFKLDKVSVREKVSDCKRRRVLHTPNKLFLRTQLRPMFNTFDIKLRSVSLVDAVVVFCWFVSISSMCIFLRFYLIFDFLVIWLSGNCLLLIVFGYGFGLRNNNGFSGVLICLNIGMVLRNYMNVIWSQWLAGL